MEDKTEFRSMSFIEVRQKQEGTEEMIIDGYIAKYGETTELYEGVYETIQEGAFDNTISDGHNIFLLYHHDYSKVLASTQNNTLSLESDSIGLRFTAKLNPKLSYSRDVYELVDSGECRGCSFGFYATDDDYTYNHVNDTLHRILKEVIVTEGTVTPIPAYDSTEVQARAKSMKEEEKRKHDIEKQLAELRTDLNLIEIENDTL